MQSTNYERGAANANLTAAEIQSHSAEKSIAEFGRIEDVEKLFAIKRGVLYQLLKAGKIKSVCLRKPGAKTGVRLVHLASVRRLLEANLE
jgi:hypothetical protein